MFNIVVCVHVLAELPLTSLHFLVFGFFFGCEVSAVSDNAFKPCGDLVPVQLHIGTIGLLQADTPTGAFNPALSRHRMRAAALTVLVFQKIRFLFGIVSTGKILINTTFTALDAASTGQSSINLILGDEHSHLSDFCHIGGVFSSQQVKVLQSFPNLNRLMVTETQNIAVFLVGFHKCGEIGSDFLTDSRVLQILCQAFRCIGKTAFSVIFQGG